MTKKNGIHHGAPRQKLIAACVSALFLPCGAALAQSSFGNSAVGADTALGNSFNQPGYGGNAVPAAAPDSYDTVRHTPTGQLYGVPIDRPDDLQTKTASGWIYSGSFEVGLFGGSPDAKYAKWLEYRDPKKGLGLNWFDFQLEKPEGAFFINGYGGGVGQGDQFYDVQVGRYNDWRVRAFYNEIPHVFSTTFRERYTLAGNNLTRVTPALNPAAGIDIPATGEIGLTRTRTGVRGDYTAVDNWRFFASATTEKREGRRPFGLNADGSIEGFEPLDQRTTDFSVGTNYVKGKMAFNLRAGLSIFENNLSTLYVTGANATTGVPNAAPADNYSIAPDNKNFSIKGDGRYGFDFWNTRLTGSFSWSSSTQNSTITPLFDGTGAFPAGAVAGLPAGSSWADWNGANGCGMIRCDSDLRIDTTMFNLGASTEPITDLTLRAGVRYLNNDNKSTPFISYNPYADYWWQHDVAVTGAPTAAGNVPTLGNNISRIGRARSDKTLNYTLSGEYLIDRKQAVNLAYERENIEMTGRERDETHEDKFKLTYTGRNFFDKLTVRGSFENARKRGGTYDTFAGGMGVASYMDAINQALQYNSQVGPVTAMPAYSLGALNAMLQSGGLLNMANGTPFAVASLAQLYVGSNGFQKTDIADRDRIVFNGRLNYSPREDIDLGLSGQYVRNKYPANHQISTDRETQNSLNLDANWQPSAQTQVGIWVSRQNQKIKAKEDYNANLVGTVVANQTAQCGSAAVSISNFTCWFANNFNPNNSIPVDTNNTTNAIGLNLTHDFGWARLGVGYTYTKNNTSINHKYSATNLPTANQASYAITGDWPDMKSRTDSLELNLVKDFTRRLTMRLMYRLDKFSSKDWHYDYLQGGPDGTVNAQGNSLSDMGPLDFRVQTIAAYLQYKF
ncbi:MAG: MtrB/PioB family outer membrane beta-barrel protein [Burkholderiaceae bacterium]|nr:MtrB/PioB family outer membrane beta-barrel protein [Burkholderiaceae bacterium]